MSTPIRTIHDLRNEIEKLRKEKAQQEFILIPKANQVYRIFSDTLYIFFNLQKKLSTIGKILSPPKQQDYFGLLAQILLPVALNKIFFRKAPTIAKEFVSVIVQKAVNHINKQIIIHCWQHLTQLVCGKKAQRACFS